MNENSREDTPRQDDGLETPLSQEDKSHEDKFNDPRVAITRRGILICVAVLLLGAIGAVGSIYVRRTRLEKSTEFWGEDTITALQLAEQIELVAVTGKEFEVVNLSGTPGLGHLRHTLLDERSYLWETVTEESIAAITAEADSYSVRLRLSDPTAHRFTDRAIEVDLKEGWVGLVTAGETKNLEEIPATDHRVQLIERVRPALLKFLETLINVKQQSYDQRD